MENGHDVNSSLRPANRYDVGHVQEVIRQAHDELRQLLQQRAEIMKRIGTVKQTISGLANLFGDGVLNEELMELVDRKSSGRQPGFTKACRMILMESEPRDDVPAISATISRRKCRPCWRVTKIRWRRSPPC